jgi:hypothetical protein
MTALFSCLITLQFFVVVLHEWVNIPGWTHGAQLQSVIGRRKLLAATLINAIFPGTAAALALFYWNRPKAHLATDYWVIYCAVTLLSAIFRWYVPYFLGANKQVRKQYARMYAGTRQVLPPRAGNPRPNLLHLCFHVLFLLNLLSRCGCGCAGDSLHRQPFVAAVDREQRVLHVSAVFVDAVRIERRQLQGEIAGSA